MAATGKPFEIRDVTICTCRNGKIVKHSGLSDYLAANRVEVFHILGDRTPTPHAMTPEARIASDGVVFYPDSGE